MNLSSRLQNMAFALVVSICGMGIAMTANAQSAVKSKVGIGYGGLILEPTTGTGVSAIHGPQMGGNVVLGVGPLLAVGLDGELMIAEAGQGFDTRSELSLTDAIDALGSGGSSIVTGNAYGIAATAGIHFGDFQPNVGVGIMSVTTQGEDGKVLANMTCATWQVTPIDIDFGSLVNVEVEYEQSFPGCDQDISKISVTGRISF